MLYIGFIFFFGTGFLATSQTGDMEWYWAKGIGGTEYDFGTNITTDKDANVLAVGTFYSEYITFGNHTLINENQYNNGYIIKFDLSGETIWVKKLESIAPHAIACGTAGNIYITGIFSSTVDFDGTIVQSNGGYDIFIAKYDSGGNFVWVQTAGGTDEETASHLTVDSQNNIYVSGEFSGSTLQIGNTELINNGFRNVFMIKYDEAGGILWARSFGTEEQNNSHEISSGTADEIVISGSWSGSGFTFASIEHTAPGDDKVFLVKYDRDGNELWAKVAGGEGSAHGRGVQTNSNNNIYQIGLFDSPEIEFDSFTLYNSSEYPDFFVVKYNEYGDVLWAKSFGGDDIEIGGEVGVDRRNNIYLFGISYSDVMTLDDLIYNNSGRGHFITKLDSSGNFMWINGTGGELYYDGKMNVHSSELIYLTNSFYSETMEIGNFILENQGRTDIVIAAATRPYMAVEEIKFLSGIFYPNPFETRAILQMETTLRDATLIISNVLGQTVRKMDKLSGNQVVIDRGNLTPGVYFLNIKDYDKQLTPIKIILH